MVDDALVAELAGLYELTGRLRKECPWDSNQTQESIVPFTVEEVYELDRVCERFGQVWQHAIGHGAREAR